MKLFPCYYHELHNQHFKKHSLCYPPIIITSLILYSDFQVISQKFTKNYIIKPLGCLVMIYLTALISTPSINAPVRD